MSIEFAYAGVVVGGFGGVEGPRIRDLRDGGGLSCAGGGKECVMEKTSKS